MQDHENRLVACEAGMQQQQQGIAEQVVADGRAEFDKVKAQVNTTATNMDNKLSAVDNKFSTMEGKLTDKLNDIDNRIAKSDSEIQMAAARMASIQDASDSAVAKHDGLVKELNQHAGLFDSKRIK